MKGTASPPPGSPQMHRREWIETLAQASPERLRLWMDLVTKQHATRVTQPPRAGLLMLTAQDSVDGIFFYLGEALVTTAEVQIGEKLGYAMVLGMDAERALIGATIDAALQGDAPYRASILADLTGEREAIRARRQQELEAVLATRVEFTVLSTQD